MNDDQRIQLIKDNIGEFPNFPIDGILFKYVIFITNDSCSYIFKGLMTLDNKKHGYEVEDIFTALTHGNVCVAIKELLVNYVRTNCPNVNVIVGLEARGFLFSLLIAAELGISCVPIRKKGKLPGKCKSYEYKLEYGSDFFEIQENSIKSGQKVIIVDDLLATGGTMNAATKLVELLGGCVEECIVVMELEDLNGRDLVPAKVHSFIKY